VIYTGVFQKRLVDLYSTEFGLLSALLSNRKNKALSSIKRGLFEPKIGYAV